MLAYVCACDCVRYECKYNVFLFLPCLSFCVCEYFSISMFVRMCVQHRATDMAVSLAQTQETTSKHSQLLQPSFVAILTHFYSKIHTHN